MNDATGERPEAHPDRHATTVDARRDLVVDTFRRTLGDARRVALVDFPNHNNCGDNAIWLGERAILDRLGIDVVSISDQASYDPEEVRRASADSVLIHGGGNFGSIWPKEQAFRERVVADHLDTPIVQLPQTVYFDGREARERARSALSQHDRLSVLARDDLSLAVLRNELGLDAERSPDAAFGIEGLTSRREAAVPIVWMSRTDGEGSVAAPFPQPDVAVVDWLRGNPFVRTSAPRASATVRLRRLYSATQRSALIRSGTRPGRAAAFDALARRRVERGIDILSFGEVVVTDRLHGHILCTLLGRRHVVLDTTHGKVSSYLATFPPPAGLVTVAHSTDEALTLARSLLR